MLWLHVRPLGGIEPRLGGWRQANLIKRLNQGGCSQAVIHWPLYGIQLVPSTHHLQAGGRRHRRAPLSPQCRPAWGREASASANYEPPSTAAPSGRSPPTALPAPNSPVLHQLPSISTPRAKSELTYCRRPGRTHSWQLPRSPPRSGGRPRRAWRSCRWSPGAQQR